MAFLRHVPGTRRNLYELGTEETTLQNLDFLPRQQEASLENSPSLQNED